VHHKSKAIEYKLGTAADRSQFSVGCGSGQIAIDRAKGGFEGCPVVPEFLK
jgi:hypothetical protein